MKETIVITGASGFIGSSLCSYLAYKYEVIAIYNNNKIEISNCEFSKIDFCTEFVKFEKLCHDLKPTTIIHCAAITDIEFCQSNQEIAYKYNVEITKSIVECCQARGIRLIYISTDSVFDGKKGYYTEKDQPNPQNIYALTKYQAELEIQKYLKNYLILRSNFFGVGVQDKKDTFAEWLVWNIKQNREIKVYKDIIFNPIFVDRFAYVVKEFIERKDLSGVYHVGSSDAVSKADFAGLIASCFNVKDASFLKKTNSNFKTLRPKNTSLSIKKMEKDLLITPDIQWDIDQFCLSYYNCQYNIRKWCNKSNQEKIIAVVPALNEEKTIEKVVNDLKSVVHEVIVVDDGSADKTAVKATEAGALVLKSSKNEGYDKSLTKGFELALARNATIIVSFDADEQHTISSMKDVLKPILERTTDISVGVRPTTARWTETLYKKYCKKFFIEDPLCGLKAYRSYAVKAIGKFDTIGSIGTELLIQAQKRNFRIRQIKIVVNKRKDRSRFGTRIKSNFKILRGLINVFRKYR